MRSKTTLLWFVLAAALFAFIWIYEHHFSGAPAPSTTLLPGLRASSATEIHISPAGAREISLWRTNNAWLLTKPFTYPAQAAGIERLLATLEKLTFATRISASELNGKKTTDAGFGFENPQFAVDLSAGNQQWHFLIGNRTAPGDQVFIRVVGVEGAFVADSSWLPQLPRAANDWRDTSLVGTAENCDWLVITNGTKVIELRQTATNHVWRMLRPLQARADGPRIAAALQQLRAATATRFVTDDAKADLTTFGLQPAETDLWLGRGTNYFAAVHAGKKTTDDASQVYARREGWNSVLTIPKDALSAWQGSVNDFRDSHLLELTAPVAEIEVANGENHFTLQAQGEKGWAIVGEKFPADTDTVLAFVKFLAGLRAEDFVKDVVTSADLQTFGLANPAHQLVLRSVAGDTNSTFARLIFGATETNRIFVKRADEDFVYSLATTNLSLPEYGWQFRQRRVWNFSETNVAQITLHQDGKTRQLQRTGTNAWSLVAGQGIISPRYIEETVQQLGALTAEGWVERNFPAPEKFGFQTNNLQLVIELKSGEKPTLEFGGAVPGAETFFASTQLEGERWIFVFPPPLAHLVAAYLTIPPTSP